VARATIERFVEHATRHYEQERQRPQSPSPLGAYVRRWIGWGRGGGVDGLNDVRAFNGHSSGCRFAYLFLALSEPRPPRRMAGVVSNTLIQSEDGSSLDHD